MKKILKLLLIVTLITIFIALLATAFLVGGAFLSSGNVSFDKEKLITVNSKISIYDDNMNEFTAYANNIKTVNINELNNHTLNAFISIEDKNFYKHKGLNPLRMVKAFFNNLTSGYIKEGASTISQQLIKNTHLQNDKTYERKVKEIMLTLRLEKTLSKKDILETYLNVIYFGNNSYGIESASNNYFGKSATELTLSESASLAGIIKSPAHYSPIYNYENFIKRRNLVLNEMYKDNYITKEEYDLAKNTEIVLTKNENSQNIYQQGVMKEASEILNLNEKEIAENGYKIYTYFNNDTQNKLQDCINNDLFYHKNTKGYTPESSAIIMNNEGKIEAFYGKSTTNLTTLKRSPASTLKPILVYAPALEKGIISPATIIKDEPINLDGYTPKNVGNTYSDNVSIRYSIEKSLNIPAVKTLKLVGINHAKNFAKNVGIEFDSSDNGYALALGSMTNGVNLKDLVGSYTTFASLGNYHKPTFIKKIEDHKNRPIYIDNNLGKRVMSEENSYLMTNMLQSSTKTGTSSRLKDLPFEVAGKTGTQGIKNTNLNTDIYSIAYTQNHIMGVWLGNPTGNNEKNLEGCNNGGTYATNMLKSILEKVYEKEKPSNFIVPPKIEKVNLNLIDLENGKLTLASEDTPSIYTKTEIFNSKYKPTEISSTFTSSPKPSLKAKLINNEVILEFETLNYAKYRIYKTIEDERILLKELQGNNSTITYIDKDILDDNLYTYHIECFVENYTNNTSLKTEKSNKVRILNI